MQKSIEPEPIEQIRVRIRAQRKGVAAQTAAEAALAAHRNLLQLHEFSQARRIAAYLSVNGEIETAPLIQAIWQLNKHIYLPVLQADGSLLFGEYTPLSPMQYNQFRILEPAIPPEFHPLPACAMDIVIVPLVAFDSHCHRIGMGAGYYDRTLANCDPDKPLRIGLAYEFQQVASIQARDWDIPMHKIVTESAVYSRTDNSR